MECPQAASQRHDQSQDYTAAVTEPAALRTTLRPYRLVFVVATLADVDAARQLCDGALGGRLNLMIPAWANATDDVRWMMSMFDPDIIVSSDLTVPPALAKRHLLTITPEQARAACYPLDLVSSFPDLELQRVLVASPEAPRHVLLNVGNASDETISAIGEHCPNVRIDRISTTAEFIDSASKDRWMRIAGPPSLYNWVQTIGDPPLEAEKLPKNGRTTIVSAPDDLDAICLFWNFRASYPEADVIWLPSNEVTPAVANGVSAWVWHDSAGAAPPFATPMACPAGYFYRRFGERLWSAFSSTRPVDVGRRTLRVFHPADRKPSSLGFDLALCMQVDDFPDFGGPVSTAVGRLFLAETKGPTDIQQYVRAGGGRLVCAVNQLDIGENNNLSFEFVRPSPSDHISALMHERGVDTRATAKSRLVPELIGLLGRLDDAKILRNRKVTDQCVSMTPRRIGRIVDEMQKGLAPGVDRTSLERVIRENVSRLETINAARPWRVSRVIDQLGKGSASLVDLLCARRLLLLGKAFDCPHCESPLWFPIDILGAANRCPWCNREIRVPAAVGDAPLGDAVRLNELVANAVDQGALPTLLLAHVLHEQHFTAPRFVYDSDLFDVASSEKVAEADLVFILGNLLGLAEAKAARGFDFAQSERLLTAAERLEADIVVFCTLLAGAATEVAEFEAHLTQRAASCRVLLVTGDDIFSDSTFDLAGLVGAAAPRQQSVTRASALPRLQRWPRSAREWERRYEPEG